MNPKHLVTPRKTSCDTKQSESAVKAQNLPVGSWDHIDTNCTCVSEISPGVSERRKCLGPIIFCFKNKERVNKLLICTLVLSSSAPQTLAPPNYGKKFKPATEEEIGKLAEGRGEEHRADGQ
jgi:hypothetical protein